MGVNGSDNGKRNSTKNYVSILQARHTRPTFYRLGRLTIWSEITSQHSGNAKGGPTDTDGHRRAALVGLVGESHHRPAFFLVGLVSLGPPYDSFHSAHRTTQPSLRLLVGESHHRPTLFPVGLVSLGPPYDSAHPTVTTAPPAPGPSPWNKGWAAIGAP